MNTQPKHSFSSLSIAMPFAALLLRGLLFYAQLILVLLVPAFGTVALAQSPPVHMGKFLISQNGKSVGKASFNQHVASDGAIESIAKVDVEMDGLDYTLSKKEVLTVDHHLQHARLNATVNDSTVTFQVDPEGTQWSVRIAADGKKTTNLLGAHSATVLMADFDPGAFETLLALAALQNNRDVWAIIPKQNGSIEPITMATYADEQGTLDGKPVIAHHLLLTIAGGTTEIFSGPENQLFQAELSQPGFALVRKGFVLTPPKKPMAR